MPEAQLVARAAAPFLDVVRSLQPAALPSPTPCTEYDLRALVNHLLFWGPGLEAAARKESLAPPAEAESDVDLVVGDWKAALEAQVQAGVAAWSAPGAWAGDTWMGPYELPAPVVGGMLVGELVVHGWDLAQATGQRPVWDDDVLEFLHGQVAYSAQTGREMGIYGPEVHVAGTAAALDRVLALTGRDPAGALLAR